MGWRPCPWPGWRLGAAAHAKRWSNGPNNGSSVPPGLEYGRLPARSSPGHPGCGGPSRIAGEHMDMFVRIERIPVGLDRHHRARHEAFAERRLGVLAQAVQAQRLRRPKSLRSFRKAGRKAEELQSDGVRFPGVHAVATTPAQGLGACFAHFPSPTSLPRSRAGSACASSFSRLARRSLALRPAHSRCHQFVTRFTRGFNHFVTSIVAPVASGWSGCRVGLSPTGKAPPLHGAP